MTTLSLTDRPVADTAASAVALLSVTGEDGARLAGADRLDRRLADYVNAALTSLHATGKEDEILRLPGGVVGDRVLVVSGSGLSAEPTDENAEAVRRAAGSAARALAGFPDASFAFPAGTATLVSAVCEGILFGAYTFDTYRTQPRPQLSAVSVHTPIAGDTQHLVDRARIVADQQAWARDLINTPPLDLFPDSFARATKEHFAGTSVRVQIMDEKDLEKKGCGGLIGVGRGSARPPRLVKLTYKPKNADPQSHSPHLALVGKGITFDSGGLCIKPATGMITMKDDMSGAAAVAAATGAIAELGLPVAVTTYLCLAENMTGADAQRPGDVVTMRNGKRVEVINTDAEGRLVMADGLSFASEQVPDLVIDVATLTGAAVLALGTRTTAVLGNQQAATDEVLAAARTAGEAMWPIPLLHHLKESMVSDVADIKHTGTREGGMIVAALFLEEFIGNDAHGHPLPWAHLDIAGPAYNAGEAYGYTPKGATGHAVRTLVQLATTRANG